jgi:hypothetical protein
MYRSLLAFGLAYALGAAPPPAKAAQLASVESAPAAIGGLSGARIFIVRHAEKNGMSDGLSPAGKMRADVYAAYFETLKVKGHPVQINSLVAAIDTAKSNRPRLTLTPLSHATGLPIMQPCRDRDVDCMVAWLRRRPAGQTTLISWHHTEIGKLMDALGVDRKSLLPHGHWPSDFFDWIIALKYDKAGRIEPGEVALIHEPDTVDDAVWAAMDHPTIRPLSDGN